jgi:hypothetical protein
VYRNGLTASAATGRDVDAVCSRAEIAPHRRFDGGESDVSQAQKGVSESEQKSAGIRGKYSLGSV